MKQLISLLFVLLVSSTALAREIPDAWPDWLKEAMARESKVTGSQSFDIADGAISGKVMGTYKKAPVFEQGLWYFSTNIGSDAEMECWLFPDGVHTASFTAMIAENLMSLSGEAQGGLGEKTLYHHGLATRANNPVFELEWLFQTGPETERRLGFTKVRTALIGSANISCAHSDVGYRATFDEAFNFLMNNVQVKTNGDAYYETLHAMRINNAPIGFVKVSMIEDADGDTEIRTEEAMLLPVDAHNVTTSDTVTTEFSFPDGELINQVVRSSENGNVVVDAQLLPAEGGWSVAGTIQGKPFETTIETQATIYSSLGQLKQTQTLLSGDEAGATEFHIWVPGIDPASMTSAEVSVGPDNQGTLKTGPITFQTEFDKNGNLERGNTAMGGMAMEVVKVWEQGSP